MVNVSYDDKFERAVSKIKDSSFQKQVKNLIKKIIQNSEIGKPMQFERKGTREVYVGSFRLSYALIVSENKLIFLDLYHKDKQ